MGRVCVTGATGYIGSWLCKKLLEKGYAVHATTTNLGDPSKVGVLKSFPNAESNLVLFEADIYKAEDFQAAIHGCDFVFHVAHPTPTAPAATPPTHQDTNMWDATVEGMRQILEYCLSSRTVKRVICTGSVMSASPLKEDGTGFGPVLDESCWTPLNLSFAHCGDFERAYTYSKTLSEKEALRYNKSRAVGEGGLELEVVSLACGLVGGESSVMGHLPMSLAVMVSPVTAKMDFFKELMLLQGMLGSVPLLHVEDACEALVFCMEQSTMSGRFLCASSYPTLADIIRYYKEEHNKFQAGGSLQIPPERECEEGHGREVECRSSKLTDIGFRYKYDMKMILDGNLDCATKLGTF